MRTRQHAIGVYRGLKSAVSRLLALYGSQDAAAAVTRVRQQELSDYANRRPEFEARHMPVDVVLDLESEIGEPVVTRELARALGYILVHAPKAAAGLSGVETLTGKVLKETGEAVTRVGAALDDGRIDRAEDVAIEREIDEALAVLCELKLTIHAEAGNGPKEEI